MRHTDEMIEHWGEVFVQNDLRNKLRITFEQFLESPRFWIREHQLGLIAVCTPKQAENLRGVILGRESLNNCFEPLLPEQRAIAERIAREDYGECTPAEQQKLDQGIEHLPRRNGAIQEPLHHHRYPRHGQSDFKKKAEA